MKRGFGVGTLEVSFDEGLDEAIEMFGRMKIPKGLKTIEITVHWWVFKVP